MAKSIKNTVILAKLQNAIGVAAVPTGADDAMLVTNPSHTPVASTMVSRDLIRPYFGNSQQLTAGVHTELSFDVEIAGSGVAGTVPAWGRLLVGCYFAETVTENTDVKYAPVSQKPNTPLTIIYHLDGLLHKLTDAYGTVSFDVTSGAIPKMSFKFMGTYNPVVDSPLPADTDFSKFLTPKLALTANTTWSMSGYTGPLQSVSLDIANTLNWFQLIGEEGAEVDDRAPTGKIVMELSTVASKDWWSAARDAVLGALTVQHGQVAGNIVQFDAPQVQISNLSYSDQNNKALLNGDLTLSPLAGNDELVITVK
ncbi:phage tail tube protein [Paraburkholderia sp. J41]|uniref:phage tail tube protein n=1 Tax=Paraburkholderia sp. J41 TaxID=2805433 RepID=UPI002AC3634E|nr:phage tail tube protein [Paraburkholderia sp. J41]